MAGVTKSPPELPFHPLCKPPRRKDLLKDLSLWVALGHCGLSPVPSVPEHICDRSSGQGGELLTRGMQQGGGRGSRGCLVSHALCLRRPFVLSNCVQGWPGAKQTHEAILCPDQNEMRLSRGPSPWEIQLGNPLSPLRH